MSDVRKTLIRLSVLYLFLAINIIPTAEIIPPVFPISDISSVYLLFLSACLIVYYYLGVAEHDQLKKMMLRIASMIFFLILLRCVKYSIWGPNSVPGRYTWYLYYVPMLLMPMFLFYASCYIYESDQSQIKRRWGWVSFFTVILILLIVTNDMHQQAFFFTNGYDKWDNNYSYGLIYYIAAVWQFLLYTAAVAALLIKSSISKILNRAWIILIPFVIGIFMMFLLAMGDMPKLNGKNIIQFPETLCFMIVGVLECCMQLGLIPINEHYRALMKITGIPVQITDFKGKVIYKSDLADNFTQKQFYSPDGTRVGEHVLMRKISIPGGYGFWEVDVTEHDKIVENLAEAKKRLAEETELIRLQNELREKQVKIEQRNAVYDDIAVSVQNQVSEISCIAQMGIKTTDATLKDHYRRKIALLTAYIKRYSNLMLILEKTDSIAIGDLILAVAEVLRYLNLYGIPGELIHIAEGKVPAKKALAVFEVFETLIEEHLGEINGVLVNITSQESDIIFKLTLENMLKSSDEKIHALMHAAGVEMISEYEDNTGYYGFVLGMEAVVDEAVV